MSELRISDASRVSGQPASTLRYWESIGLIHSARTTTGYRLFDRRAIERFRFIGAAKRLDLSLDTIRDLLRSWDEKTCRSVKQRLRPTIRRRLTQAEDSIAELTVLVQTLRAGLDRLSQLPDRDSPCDPSCGFLTPAPTARPEPEAPIACTLVGDDHVERLQRWHALLDTAHITRSGLTASAILPSDKTDALVQLIRTEQRCCPFFGFRLEFTGDTAIVTITAPSTTASPSGSIHPPGSGLLTWPWPKY